MLRLRPSPSKAALAGGLPINRFIEETNANAEFFIWTADPDRAATNRGRKALESVH